MGSLLKALWPFIVEVFVKNRDVRDSFKSPAFLLKFALVISLVFFLAIYLYGKVGELLYDTHGHYRDVSRDFIEIEKGFRDSLRERAELENKLNAFNVKYRTLEADRNRLDRINRDMAIHNERLRQELENLRVPECQPVRVPSRVRDLLDRLEEEG